MNDTYLHRLTTVLRHACPRLGLTHRITFKNVFGAVGGYVDGRIFISCGVFGIALKLPPETLKKIFREKGVKHLKYFRNGHVKKEYAVIPKRMLGNKRQIKKVADESITYVLSL